jgi:hypothetical protein
VIYSERMSEESAQNKESESESESEKVTYIKERLQHLKDQRTQFEPQWKENEKFVSTSVYEFLDIDSDEKKELAQRFTSIPGKYMRQEAAGIVGYSASRAVAWLHLAAVDPDLKDKPGVLSWMGKCQDILVAALRKSNFYKQVYLGVKDGAVYGWSATSCEWDAGRNRLQFNTRKLGEVYLDCDEAGEADTLYREYKLRLRQAAEYFGTENLSEQDQKDYTDGTRENLDKEITIIEAVEANPDYNEEGAKTNAVLKKYAHVYVESADSHIIRTDGFDDFPYGCLVWEEIPNSPYGISPTEAAIIDIRADNKVMESALKIAQRSATPPLNVPRALKGVSLNPGAENYYDKSDMKIDPIKTGDNYQIVLNIMAAMDEKIKYHYDVDFFQMLAMATGSMTATEVTERQGEKATVLGPLIENVNSYLEKLVMRAFNLLADNGKLPEVPGDMKGMDVHQLGLQIEFTGTLAQAQKKYYQSGGISNAMGMIIPIAQVQQNITDNIDFDALARSVLVSNNLPSDCIRDKDKVETIRKAREAQAAQVQAQTQKQQMVQSLMQNSDKLNKPVDNASILGQVNTQLAGAYSR